MSHTKLSANLFDIYHCCVYSEKLLMMDRGTAQKHAEFCSKNKFEIGSWWGNRRERDQWEDLVVDVWIILGRISRKWDVGI
jgi:hypothetical protein